MTVIREKPNHNYPKPDLVTNSDTESNLVSLPTSDAESLNEEPHSTNSLRVYRLMPKRFSHNFEDLKNVKKSYGKRKLRRYINKCSLYTLSERDKEEDEDFNVVEQNKSPLTRLLEDEEALQYWNSFIEKTELEQFDILKDLSNTYSTINEQCKEEFKKPGKLSSRIRRTIKIRKNLSLEIVKECEDDLITFFKATPREVYVKYPPTSFDRLLLHGIAQYHRLMSISIQVDNGAPRSVEVYNLKENWTPAEQFLTDFIKQLRK